MTEGPGDTLTITNIQGGLESENYVADHSIVMALYLSLKLNKPLLVEGESGCGKTEIAKVLSKVLGTELIRLQCYEGLDVNSALYEWDYLRQMLMIRMRESSKSSEDIDSEIFSERFILQRPLLRAIRYDGPKPPVLLIDEIDRADEEFEGFLLELLGEFQVTIPEIGTLKARRTPIVVITSNRTRELGDGIRRRCLYLYITYPPLEKELRIIKLKVPGIGDRLAVQIAEFMRLVRQFNDISKKPGIAETLDWANALVSLNSQELSDKITEDTLSCVLKASEDITKVKGERLSSIIQDISK